VDFTLGILTQAAFALLGVALLVTEMGLNQQSGAIVAGLLLAMLPLLLFLVLQQRGLFALGATVAEKLARGGRWRAFAGDARRVDRGVRGLYARRQPVTRCTITRTLSWIVGTGETWLTLHLLGVPATVADALILESLGYAVRSAAFAVPGALGVQEGGFMVLGALLGLSPTDALVLSLVKRVREVLLGVPGLASWAVYEVRQR
jgi:putative membrane protein